MKSLLLLVSFSLVISYSPPLVAQSPRDRSQVLQDERKVRIKDGKTITRDKSKPVRRAIEYWYAGNMAAFAAKDLLAIMALRADDFHTITPDGKVNTRADMETRTRVLLDRIDHFICQDNQIGTIEVEGDLASADITQKTVRMQRFPDGKLHKIESVVVQRETWKKTAEGWKLYRVDNIRDGSLLVDDKPFKPNQ